MKLVDTKDAVGHVLCHDITQIIPGKSKGPVFRKGHIVKPEDIDVLLSVGKEHLYVWENNENMLHENEAAFVLKDICVGDATEFECGEPKEGKIEIMAAMDGLLKVDTELLNEINGLGEMMIATVHGNFPVKKGDKLAGTRIIPLVIEKSKMDKAKDIVNDRKILSILPFKTVKYAIVTTGSEVFKGIIKDAFGPVLKNKMEEYGAVCIGQKIVDDSKDAIVNAINDYINKGVDIVLCTGGMSVDPDDQTPGAIKATGARIVSYGAPTLPGAMFLLSYYEQGERQIPVIGLPGCVMYARRTIFDLVLPRLIAGEQLNAKDLLCYGEGGMCLNCEKCHFPNCGFGK
ncbi:MAG: molybdopterin-binding protein [Lachnospiraceae bacterium]|nr:molybdopterin-binding protein [Lachnospiraceae bacterium]